MYFTVISLEVVKHYTCLLATSHVVHVIPVCRNVAIAKKILRTQLFVYIHCIQYVNLNKSFVLLLQEKPRVSVKKFVKIGRPGYKGMEKYYYR